MVWLVNAGDSFDTAYEFMNEANSDLPCLLDSSQSLYRSYPPGDGAYAPFPLQVVIDREGVVTYLSHQHDVEATRHAIQEALDR